MDMNSSVAFWHGVQLHDFLFEGFSTQSSGGFIGLLTALLSISILNEGLRQLRDFFLNRFVDTRKTQTPPPRSSSTKRCDSIRYYRNEPTASSPIENEPEEPTESSRWLRSRSSSPRVRVEDLILASLLHMVYISLGYVLMLAVMTFNVYIFVVVCGGVGIGYLVFGTFRRLDHLATHTMITKDQCPAGGGEESSSGCGEPRLDPVDEEVNLVVGAQVH